jgi:hypothetical protein
LCCRVPTPCFFFSNWVQYHFTHILQNSERSPPDHQTLKAIQGPEKSVISLSEHVLTEPEEFVLKKGPNFAITNKESDLDMACAAESARSKLPPALGMDFYWQIQCVLEKSRPFTSNMMRRESAALKSLKTTSKYEF